MIRSFILLILLLLPLFSHANHTSWHPSLYENNISRLNSVAGQNWSEDSTRSNQWWATYNEKHIVADRYCEEHEMEAKQYLRAKYWDGWAFLKDVRLDAVVHIIVKVKDPLLDNADLHLSTKAKRGLDRARVLYHEPAEHELGVTEGDFNHVIRAAELLSYAIASCSSVGLVKRLDDIRMGLEDSIFDEPINDINEIYALVYKFDGSTGKVTVNTLPYYCKH